MTAIRFFRFGCQVKFSYSMFRFDPAPPSFRQSVLASECVRITSFLDAYARSYSRAASDPDHAVTLRLTDKSCDGRDLVELLQNGLMKAFEDAIGLRMAHLRLRMFDNIQSQIELVIMRLRTAAEFRTEIGQDPDHSHALFGEERQHSVVFGWPR